MAKKLRKFLLTSDMEGPLDSLAYLNIVKRCEKADCGGKKAKGETQRGATSRRKMNEAKKR